MMSKAIKLGIAKRVYDEARKPENQRRIKELLESAKAQVGARRGGKPGGTSGGQAGRRAS